MSDKEKAEASLMEDFNGEDVIEGTDGDKMKVVMDVPVKVDVELGSTNLSIKELLAVKKGSVLALSGYVGDHLKIYVNRHQIAHGEVVVLDDNKYGVRIIEVVGQNERMKRAQNG